MPRNPRRSMITSSEKSQRKKWQIKGEMKTSKLKATAEGSGEKRERAVGNVREFWENDFSFSKINSNCTSLNIKNWPNFLLLLFGVEWHQ